MKQFFYKLESKFRSFMHGRYGMDQLYKGLLYIYLGVLLIALILGRTIDGRIYTTLSTASLAIVIFAFFRVFSKNIEKRKEENAKWLIFENSIKRQFRLIKNKWNFRKTHIFKRCPKCKAVLRLKRKKGTHTVICPHCKENFKIRIIF